MDFQQSEELHKQVWNKVIWPEFKAIWDEKYPGKHTNDGFSLEENGRRITAVVREWHKRYPNFRYIKGHFYHITLSPEHIPSDGMTVKKLAPDEFADYVSAMVNDFVDVIKQDEARQRKERKILGAVIAIGYLALLYFAMR